MEDKKEGLEKGRSGKPLFNISRAGQGQSRESVQGICGARKARNENLLLGVGRKGLWEKEF